MLGAQPEYRSMIAVDVERSAGRGNVALMKVRDVLFTALREACASSGIDWSACHRSDLGDGMVLVGPRGMANTRFIYPFSNDLAERLRAHNRTASDLVRIRVRMAAHAGSVYLYDGMVAGSPLEFLARMLDAGPVKDGLAAAPETTTVGLVVSPHVFDEVVRHGYVGIDPDSFHRVEFSVKETVAEAWVQLAGGVSGAPSPVATPAPIAARSPVGARDSGSTQHNISLTGSVFAVQHGTQNVYPRES